MGSASVDGVMLALSAAGAQKEEGEGCVRVYTDKRRIYSKQMVGFDLEGNRWRKHKHTNHREQHNLTAFGWRGWRGSQNEMTLGLFHTQSFVHFQAAA